MKTITAVLLGLAMQLAWAEGSDDLLSYQPSQPIWQPSELVGVAVNKYMPKNIGADLWVRTWDIYEKPDIPMDVSMSFSSPRRGVPLRVKVISAKGAPLLQQAMAIKQGQAGTAVVHANIEQAAEYLEFERYELTDNQCPALARLLEQYNQLSQRVPQVRIGGGLMDVEAPVAPRQYAIYRVGIVTTMDLVIQSDSEPLAKWAEKARKQVMACRAKAVEDARKKLEEATKK